MELKNLKVGDVVEVSTYLEVFLAEIFGISDDPTDPYPIKILIPRNAIIGALFRSESNLSPGYISFAQNLDQTKLIQHKLYLISINEIKRLTDQKW